MNLGKLIPLEVHGRVRNAKIENKYFPMSEWGVPYTVGKLKRRSFHQAKEHADWLPGLGDTALGSPRTKSREFPGVSRECPGSVPERPHDPKGRGGGPAEGCRSICMGEPLRVAARSRY